MASHTEQAHQRGSRRFTNREWLALLAASAVAIAGTTAAALNPDRSVAGAAAASAQAPAHACPKTPTAAVAATVSAPATLTSTVATSSAASSATTTTAGTATVTRRARKRKAVRRTTVASSSGTTTTVVAAPSLVSVGTLVTYGSYGGAPLTWQVLAADDSSVLLLSKYVVSAGAFRSDWEGQNASLYRASDVRTWLKTTFAEKAFDTTQSAALVPRAGGGATGDRVFLLTAAELKKYLPTASSRKAAPGVSAGAGQTGFSGEALALTGPYAAWWLADPATDDFEAQIVKPDGSFGSQLVYYADLGVRPAIRVDREKIGFSLEPRGGN